MYFTSVPVIYHIEHLEGKRTNEEINYRFINEIPPIQLRWELINTHPAIQRWADEHPVLAQDWDEARLILEHHSRFNGDIIEGPAPILMPSAVTWEVLGWVVKGTPDDTTFVISRYPLPWLNATRDQTLELSS